MPTTMDLHLATPLTLPSGLTLPNRLAKAAMAESLSGDGLPSPAMHRAYAAWADGGWGMVLTGNVMVDARHLGQPRDVRILDEGHDLYQKMLPAWREWAAACKAGGGSATATTSGAGGTTTPTPTLVQVNHPGRQSPMGAGARGLWAKTLAPSAVPLQLGSGLLARLVSAVVFGTPREMTVADIEDVVRRFAETARISAEAGFDGVEIQYVLRSYSLSPLVALDPWQQTLDVWGGGGWCGRKIDIYGIYTDGGRLVLLMAICSHSSRAPRRT